MSNEKILVICTGNSCRSQMAEGYLKYFTTKMKLNINVFSAGIEAHGINNQASQTMLEDGVDISGHTSNTITEYINKSITHVITVCDHANQNCPIFPESTIKTHKNFKDPSKFSGNSEETKIAFSKTRNEIKIFCKNYLINNFNK